MAKVKFGPVGLVDMLYFKNKPKQREKKIAKAAPAKLTQYYDVNLKAMERHPDEQKFKIQEIINESNDTKTYVLKSEKAAFFRAGQYVVVRQKINGKLICRPVSISSSPKESLDGIYKLTIKYVQDGFLSKYIHEKWKVGDEVITSGPQGTFYYEGLRDSAYVVAAAGGSGITPFISMAQAIVDDDEDFHLTILYGANKKEDLIFKNKLDSLAQLSKKVKVVYVVADTDGFITEEVIRKHAPKHGEFSLFAAGPQKMYLFLDKEAEKIGLNNKHYRKELFGSLKDPWTMRGYPKDAKDKTFNLHVKMCNKEYDIPCNANESMMVALERAGIAGPNRCRGGVCGWCRSKLISGRVFVPNDTDGRRQADKVWGYIHPCASFAVSDVSIDMPNNK